jgi:hypothetical protein
VADEGSSLLDLAVHHEMTAKGRDVYMDFLHNPAEFTFEHLPAEAREYLEKSGAIQTLPIERLAHMNQKAIQLYADHNIDLWTEPLQVAVCAQHCNGGATGDIWWETSVPGLFAIGEVNGSHGVHRPGGAALNAGQVGAIRAAERIAFGNRVAPEPGSFDQALQAAWMHFDGIWAAFQEPMEREPLKTHLERIRLRMTRGGAHLRDPSLCPELITDWDAQRKKFFLSAAVSTLTDFHEALRIWDALVTQGAFLAAFQAYFVAGGGSRGSALVLAHATNPGAVRASPALPYTFIGANHELKSKILEVSLTTTGDFTPRWVAVRPVPDDDPWFETTWQAYDSRSIFR